jgi:hypothetical protein
MARSGGVINNTASLPLLSLRLLLFDHNFSHHESRMLAPFFATFHYGTSLGRIPHYGNALWLQHLPVYNQPTST